MTGAAISVLQAQLQRARRRAEAEAAKRKRAEEAFIAHIKHWSSGSLNGPAN
jgi:hypothetical protein